MTPIILLHFLCDDILHYQEAISLSCLHNMKLTYFKKSLKLSEFAASEVFVCTFPFTGSTAPNITIYKKLCHAG